ncbi:hypothetical protein Nepgr_024789 [Nepenthes gracilis]|uniref:Uncharacterized protein n=1 Tax=Nepenthes gracilis TaxID=150966 RepID=A0AAD3T5E9_NEPGR|nr:hypothetical protein Nepgr_024789 [Nepenthes gracilis]
MAFQFQSAKKKNQLVMPFLIAHFKPSNVAQKQAETPAAPRKPTPERKRSSLKGKNSSDQSENSRPVNALQGRFIDQHQWPSRVRLK